MPEKPHACPVTPELAKQLCDTIAKMDERLQNIEKFMFAGRVAFTVISMCAIAMWWILQHADYIKSGIISWLKG
jgi:hypothetical protein